MTVRKWGERDGSKTSCHINQTKIIIDGIDLSEIISSIKFTHKGGEAPVMEIEIIHCEVSIRSPQVPRLPKIFENYYRPID